MRLGGQSSCQSIQFFYAWASAFKAYIAGQRFQVQYIGSRIEDLQGAC